jgi:hypothetical protein
MKINVWGSLKKLVPETERQSAKNVLRFGLEVSSVWEADTGNLIYVPVCIKCSNDLSESSIQ